MALHLLLRHHILNDFALVTVKYFSIEGMICRNGVTFTFITRYVYKYPTNLHSSSFNVVNVLSIFSHGISFEKTSLTTWGLEPASPVISHQPCYPLDHHACPKKEASRPEISLIF